MSDLRCCLRGDLGQIGMRFSQTGDRLVALCGCSSDLVAARVGETRSLRLDLSQWSEQPDDQNGTQLRLGAGEGIRELVPLLR